MYFQTYYSVSVSTLRPTNILYVLLFGWWMALIYLLVSLLMLATVIGYSYGKLKYSLFFASLVSAVGSLSSLGVLRFNILVRQTFFY